MKLNKNIVIPMTIILTIFIIGILVKAAPALPVILVTIMIILPILLMQQKTNNNWGQMFVVGIFLAIIYVALIIGIFTLANNYGWLKRIFLWPA